MCQSSRAKNFLVYYKAAWNLMGTKVVCIYVIYSAIHTQTGFPLPSTNGGRASIVPDKSSLAVTRVNTAINPWTGFYSTAWVFYETVLSRTLLADQKTHPKVAIPHLLSLGFLSELGKIWPHTLADTLLHGLESEGLMCLHLAYWFFEAISGNPTA